MAHLGRFFGAFDVHITVDENEIYLVNQFCELRKISLAYAIGLTGSNKQQLMTSTYKLTTDGRTVFNDATQLANQMKSAGIGIKRIKIEAIAENPEVVNFIKTAEYQNNNHYYYEFHYKVKILSDEDQKKLETACHEHHVAYAINFLSRNRRDPLISQRIRGDYQKALVRRTVFQEALKSVGLESLQDGTHFEFVIYDDNPQLDQGMVEDPFDVGF
jgi:hypothetical protein